MNRNTPALAFRNFSTRKPCFLDLTFSAENEKITVMIRKTALTGKKPQIPSLKLPKLRSK
jgi:hypothetical protein